MDHFYTIFIILAILWVGFCILSFLKPFKKMLDFKRDEQGMRMAEYQTKIQRENANLALQNDLRGIIRLIAKNYYPQKKKTDKNKKKKTKETK